jgi:peptidoglycan/xylan/chitin deacetylase (PgdA/CDA1 family)
VVGFLAATALIWSGYFWWRPPAPMLHLKTISHLPLEKPHVSLTFDDSPHPLTTPLLLASLKRANVQATFFVVGEGMRHYPELTRRIVADGHTLANHSQHHHNLTTVTPAEYSDEVFSCFDAIKSVGKDRPWRDTKLFRPPGGGLDRSTMQYLYEQDVTLAWWTNNVGDWAPLPAWRIAYHISNSLRPGDIILLHDAGTSTPQAIPAIVREARKRGLEFVPMPEDRD